VRLAHSSFSVHVLPSLQDDPSGRPGCVQAPAPSHSSSVQVFASAVHGVPGASKQESASSSQASAHSDPLMHGSPAWTSHAPPLQVSAPLQKSPSLQGPLFAA
jgi:hypothetical protein